MIAPVCDVVLCFGIGALCLSATAQGQPRAAAAILADLEKQPMPSFAGGPAVLYSDENLDIVRRRSRFIEELWKHHPKHARTPKLVRQRWDAMSNVPPAFVRWDGLTGKALSKAMRKDLEGPVVEKLDAVRKEVVGRIIEETERAIAQDPDGPLALEAYYPRARQLVGRVVDGDRSDVGQALAAVDVMIKRVGAREKPFMLPRLLMWLADHGFEEISDKRRIEILRRVERDYPDTLDAKTARGKRLQIEAIGKPFKLDFKDAITGRPVSIEQMRGKVVVLDFWATWCLPCIAEMPKIQAMYDRYHDRGLEIIGVSLDFEESRGGLKNLKSFVKKHEIPWPQFYTEGEGGDPDFSRNWGVYSIPSLFVIDKKGRLRSTTARGKLETLVPKLLAE